MKVRRTARKFQHLKSQGGVPQAYLTHKKRRLQRMRKEKSMEQQVEVILTKPKQKTTSMKKVWKPK